MLGSEVLNFFFIGGALAFFNIKFNEKMDLWILSRDILFFIPALFMICYFNE